MACCCCGAVVVVARKPIELLTEFIEDRREIREAPTNGEHLGELRRHHRHPLEDLKIAHGSWRVPRANVRRGHVRKSGYIWHVRQSGYVWQARLYIAPAEASTLRVGSAPSLQGSS